MPRLNAAASVDDGRPPGSDTQVARVPDEPMTFRNDRRLRSPAWLVVTLGLGVFFAGFDQTFVVTILPDMMRDLGISVDNFGRAAWIVNGYLLGYTVAMPLIARVADAFGHVRLYTLSIGIFVIGSFLVAIAPTLETLTIARVIQAIGGGAIVPISIAIIADTLSLRHRAIAIGSVAALDDASSLLGPLYAASLVGLVGWRGLFLIDIVLQLPFLFAIRYLARDVRRTGRSRIDWQGGLLLAAGLSAMTFAMTGDAGGAMSGRVLAFSGLLAIMFTIAFVWRQLRVPSPLVHLQVLRERAAGSAMALYFIDGAATITALVSIPLMTNTIWNGSALDGGINLMKMMVWMPAGGVLGGLICRFTGFRLTAIMSFAMYGSAFTLMWMWPVPPGETLMILTLTILGLGIGLNDAPIIGSILLVARRMESATIVALTQTVQTIGMIAGMALLATRGLGRFDERAADLFAERGIEATTGEYQAIMHQTFSEVFIVAAAVTFAAIVLATFLSSERASEFIWTPFAWSGDRGDPPKPD
jgi:MFS family permease